MRHNNIPDSITHFEKDGERILYHGCTSKSREEGDAFYLPLGFEYIGESNIIYVNGTRNEFPQTYYFYKRK